MDPLECGYDYAWRMDAREVIGGQDAWGWPDPVQSEVRTFNWGNHEFNECPITVSENFSINNIYPNPFDMVTNITYELPNHANVRVVIYNLLGREIETLTDGIQARGNHSVSWNASSYAAGVYFIRMDSGDPFKNWTWISQNKQNICLSRECTSFEQTRKVVLVK